MPYLAHFGLKDWPFGLTPNTGLYFASDEHRDVLDSLLYAVRRGEGIVKVVGEVGTGKTLLCRMLLAELDPEMAVAYITSPQDDRDMVVKAVVREFGLPDTVDDPVNALQTYLIDLHSQGKQAVIVVDEAQALGSVGLETIRLLSNLETETTKLLQIVLFGQPELDQLLQGHHLRQVNQRIAYSFQTRPLSEDSAIAYLQYRIERVAERRSTASNAFDRAALKALAKASGGLPRLLNILADKALMVAFGAGSRQVKGEHAKLAVADTPTARTPPGLGSLPWWFWTGTGVSAVMGFLAGLAAAGLTGRF